MVKYYSIMKLVLYLTRSNCILKVKAAEQQDAF